MARSWAQLLGDSDEPEETVDEQRGFFGRLRESLAKSRRALTEQIQVAAFDPDRRRIVGAARGGARSTPTSACVRRPSLIRRLEARGDVTELGEALAEEIADLFGEPATFGVSGPSRR